MRTDLNHLGYAWLSLAAALALHVTDEALTGFLDVYNPAVRIIRASVPYLPLPIFRFDIWLSGLIVGIGLLLLATPAAFHQHRWLRRFAYPFALLMCGNGLLHLAISIYWSRWLPGVYSAPLLLTTASYLLWALRHTKEGLK